MRIFLLGMPGSGKSSLGKRLSRKIELPFFDLDSIIEEREGMSIIEVFELNGEAHFRQLEHRVLMEICDPLNEAFIVATGGGTPCFHDNLKRMEEVGKTIYLKHNIEELVLRLQDHLSDRPLLKNVDNLNEYLQNLLEKRKAWYNRAQITLESDNLTVDGLVTAVLNS